MMTKETILSALLAATDRHPNMIWMIAALYQANRPVQKEHLRDITNALYLNVNPDQEKPIRSRYLLDEAAAMLEGAALVDVKNVAKSKRYTVSELGMELMAYRKQRLNQQKQLNQQKEGTQNEN